MAQQFGTRYRGLEMKRVSLAILLALSTLLAGCFGGGETVIEESAEETPIWVDYEIIDPITPISMGIHNH